MFCLRVPLLLTLTTVLTNAGDENKKCFMLLSGAMRCCRDPVLPQISEAVEECLEIPYNPHSCTRAICVGKKLGYASDDGTIDMETFEKVVDDYFKSSPTLVNAINEKCIKSDTTYYGPPDACQATKINTCTRMAIAMDCKKWDDSGLCTGIKDNLDTKCSTIDV